MRIGVISDTHISSMDQELPPELLKVLEKVDLILHAGDILILPVLDELNAIAPTEAVCGNMDKAETRAALPGKRIVAAGGRKIGLIHGSGPPFGLANRVRREFDDVDIVVFGHSHRPYNKTKGGVFLFNPGSPTDTFFAPYRSCGIITIEEEITAEIIRL